MPDLGQDLASGTMRLPGYLRRCLCKRRCALPCALALFILYGFYTKDAAVHDAVDAEEAAVRTHVLCVCLRCVHRYTSALLPDRL